MDLSRAEADIALRSQRPTRGDLLCAPLGPFRSRVLGADFLYADAAPIASLDELRWIQWGESLEHIPDAKWVASHVEQSSIALRTCSFSAKVEAVKAGVGVMLTAEPFSNLPGLCRVPLVGDALAACETTPELPLFLVGHQALRQVPRVSVAWSFLKALISKRNTEGNLEAATRVQPGGA